MRIIKTFLFLFIFCQVISAANTQPNIIFILADDLSYRDLSCYGQQVYKTPNLDKLAEQGVRFTQAYSASAECAPARGSLMTGLHTGHGPIRVNSSARGQDHLKDSDITIAEALKKEGYMCGFAGKWGIGQPGTEGVPYKQGFDYTFGYYDQVRAHTYIPDYLWENDRKILYPQNKGFNMQKRYDINKGIELEQYHNTYNENGELYIEELKDPYGFTYSETEVQKATLKFITQNSKQPFFFYYATQLPHGPVIADNMRDLKDLNEIPQPNREWAAMVQALDDFTGKLVDTLKALKIYDNTIIFFASDNGYAQAGYLARGNAPKWPDDPYFKNKGPFTGGKFSVLEGGCRIPFFVSCPAKFKASVKSQPVWLPDFFPTALELAKANNTYQTDGKSLLALMEGRNDDYQSHPYLYFSKARQQAVRMGPWKAFRAAPTAKMNLFLVEEDTYGKRNLAEIYPEIVKQIEEIMEKEHTPHEWYWNPWETAEEYKAKQTRAKETGNKLQVIRPNNLEKLPWEKD